MKKTALVAAVLAAAFAAPAMADNSINAFVDYQSISLSNAGSLSSPAMLRVGAAFGTGPVSNELSYSMSLSDSSYSSTSGNIGIALSSLAYNAVGKFAIEAVSGLNLTGKIGVSYNSAKATATGVYAANNGSSASTFGLQYGIGAEYAVNDKFAVRAGWESLGKFKAEDTASGVDATALTIGASYSF